MHISLTNKVRIRHVCPPNHVHDSMVRRYFELGAQSVSNKCIFGGVQIFPMLDSDTSTLTYTPETH
jgi:hypothetical protein